MVRALLAGFGGEEEPDRKQDDLGGPPDAPGEERFRARGLVDDVIGEGIEGELGARDEQFGPVGSGQAHPHLRADE